MFDNKHLLVAALSCGLLIGAPSAANAGVDKLADKCNDCHGKDGVSTESKVPTIAGFSPDALQDILTQFKEGDRKGVKFKAENGKETDMNAIAEKLSDADITALSKYYSAKKFKPAKQKFDAAMAKKGAKVHDKLCEKCHSDGGSNADDDAAILAGQWRAYLEEQFKLIAAKERNVPKKMKKKFKKLKGDQAEELIEFYASQQ